MNKNTDQERRLEKLIEKPGSFDNGVTYSSQPTFSVVFVTLCLTSNHVYFTLMAGRSTLLILVHRKVCDDEGVEGLMAYGWGLTATRLMMDRIAAHNLRAARRVAGHEFVFAR